MAAYYNEIDPHCAQWLRNLIAAGLIPSGVVDERSIEDVRPEEIREFDQCHFFAGIGIWAQAGRDAGIPDDYPYWSGSCPCQPFSEGGKGLGFADERHLWPAFHHLVRVRRPLIVFGEQVADGRGLAWLDLVQEDLEGEGYAVGSNDLGAPLVGAPHERQRLYWVAYSDDWKRVWGPETTCGYVGDWAYARWAKGHGQPEDARTNGFWRDPEWVVFPSGRLRPVEPGTAPVAAGAPPRNPELRAFGNGLVRPLAVAFMLAALEYRP